MKMSGIISTAIVIIICFTIQSDHCSALSEACSWRDIEMNNRYTCPGPVFGNIIRVHNPEPEYDVILEEHLNCPSRPIRDSIISDKSHTWSGYLMKNLLIKPLVNTLDIYNRCVNMVFNDHQANFWLTTPRKRNVQRLLFKPNFLSNHYISYWIHWI